MQYAYEKLMEALGALVSEGPLPQRLEHAFNPLARLRDDDFDEDLRERWTEIRGAGDRMRGMTTDDLRALAGRVLSLFMKVAARDQLSRDGEALEKARGEIQAAQRKRAGGRPAKSDTVSAVVILRRRGSEKFEAGGQHEFSALPRLGEFVARQDLGRVVFYRVLGFAHAGQPCPTAGDLYLEQVTEPGDPLETYLKADWTGPSHR
jgi:hypothetical protein